jgi:methylthioribose-1-phosphate isomerase
MINKIGTYNLALARHHGVGLRWLLPVPHWISRGQRSGGEIEQRAADEVLNLAGGASPPKAPMNPA